MIDLHMHSNFSDGSFSIPILANVLKMHIVEYVALTDHDNILGVTEFASLAKSHNVKSVSGVEITSIHNFIPLHILGYGFNIRDTELLDMFDFLSSSRLKRATQIIEKSCAIGLPITIEQINEVIGTEFSNIGKPHIAKTLIRYHYEKLHDHVESVCLAEVIELMNRKGILFIEKEKIEATQAIKAIHNAGGYAVLAHPNERMTIEVFREAIDELVGAGLDGIECFFSKSSKSESEIYLETIQKNKLIMTAGSDFHGSDDRYIGGIDYYDLPVESHLLNTIKTFFS